MKNKTTFIVTVLLLFCSLSIAHAATTLMQIGRNPFHPVPLDSVSELIAMIQKKELEVKKGFALANRKYLFEPFMEQITNGHIGIDEFHKGSKFNWMLYKKTKNGSVRIAKNVTWGNKKPFTGFTLYVEHGNLLYTFVVPLGCGNVALMDSSMIPEKVVTGVPPDASKPEIQKVAPPPKVKTNIIETRTDTDAIVGLRVITDMGYYNQVDPAHYILGRIGLEYRFAKRFSVLALVGGASHFDGTDGKTALLADLLVEYDFSRYFINLGVGGWITDGDDKLDAEDSQTDLIAAFGVRIYGEPETFNTSLFFEIRSAIDEFDGLIDYGRFGMGFRLRF